MKHISLHGVLLLLAISVLATGCLQTRESMQGGDQREVLRDQIKNLSQANAEQAARQEALNEDIRRLMGRIEILEAKLQKVNESGEPGSASQQQYNQLIERLKVYEEALNSLDQKVTALLKNASARAAQPKTEQAPAGNLAAGDYYFDRKQWKDAIMSFEKYRKANPSGKSYGIATYKIGVSFQEMGYVNDAKAFFQEVVDKFPGTDAAKKAEYRLKTIAKN